MSSVSEKVRAQYEALPYPYRDPVEEAEKTRFVFSDYLDAVNHHCFQGKRDFNKPFRVLVAGGGTGDSFVFLAEQLAHTDNEVVYIDLSAASSDIARQRIEQKGITKNCRMIQGSLLDIPKMDLGKFDFINCTGVLHHLEDPSAGLKTLASALKPDGAMHIMVYGRYGRAGVYPMQKLMRLLCPDGATMPEKIAATRRVLEQLPQTNWFKRTEGLFNTEEDTELYDLLLHCQDRPYNMSELLEWLAGAGLRYVETESTDRPFFTQPYHGKPGKLASRIRTLPIEAQRGVGEIMWGLTRKHAFWAAADGETPLKADFCDGENVPFFARNPQFITVRENLMNSEEAYHTIETDYKIRGASAPIRVGMRFRITPILKSLLRAIDNRRTTAEIIQSVARRERTDEETVRAEFIEMAHALESRDLLLLRHKSTRQLRWSADPLPKPRGTRSPHLMQRLNAPSAIETLATVGVIPTEQADSETDGNNNRTTSRNGKRKKKSRR